MNVKVSAKDIEIIRQLDTAIGWRYQSNSTKKIQNKWNKIRSNTEEGDNNTFSIEISSCNEGSKVMVDCLGLGLCEENYLSNSITNPEMIKVKLCCRQNDFNKVLSTSCNFSTNNIPTQRWHHYTIKVGSTD